MRKWSDGAHPLVQVAEAHKRRLKMVAESIDVVLARPGTVVSTLKLDGEHTVIGWNINEPADCVFANSYGTLRTDLPPSKELASILQKTGWRSAILAGELYAVHDDGSRMALNEVMHHIKAPKDAHEESRIRMALFDIIQIDDSPLSADYWQKIVLLNTKIGSGNQFVHIVPARQGDVGVVKDMWERDVIGGRMEGLVVHTPGGIIKVKVISTMDLVIVGMKREGKRFARGEAGSLLPAFMLPDGTFVPSSSVTVAQPAEQKTWFEWVMAHQRGEIIIEGTPFVMCEPLRIFEIGANEWYAYDTPTIVGLKYANGRWEKLGLYPGVTGQKPRFIKDEQGRMRERLDKRVNPIDLRLTQCPDFDEAWLAPYQAPKPTGDAVLEWNKRVIAQLKGEKPAFYVEATEVERLNRELIARLKAAKSNPYSSHGVSMPFKKFVEIEVEERGNYTPQQVAEWVRKYDIKPDTPVIWVAFEKWIANRYNLDSDDWDRAEEIPEEEMDVVEIPAEAGTVIEESDDGDGGYLMILKAKVNPVAGEYLNISGGI